MTADELTSKPLYKLADLLQKRAVSPVELIDVFLNRIDEEIHEAVKKAIMVCGQCKADLVDIDMPPMEKTRTVSLVIQLPEMLSYHSRYLPKKKDLYGKDLRAGMALGQFILAEHYIQAKRMVQWYRLKMEESFLTKTPC